MTSLGKHDLAEKNREAAKNSTPKGFPIAHTDKVPATSRMVDSMKLHYILASSFSASGTRLVFRSKAE
jgi:hypothetical protein